MNEETLDTTPSAPADTTPAEPAPAPEPVAAEPAHEPTMDETIRETWAKLRKPERERGENGRFLKTSSEPVAAPDDTGGEAEAPEVVASPSPEPKPHDAAPNTWRKELQAEFGALPESVRQEIHRREADFHKGISQYRDAAAFGNSMFEDISPHFDLMRQLGGTPKEVVREVLGTWRTLVAGTPEQKRATLLQLANGYGINLAEASEMSSQASALPPEIAPVLQRVEHLERTITEAQRAREQAEQAKLLGEAEKFLADPKHEFMDAVFEDVLALVKSGLSPEDAYNKAIWSNPDTRETLITRRDEERRKREAAEAAAARKAAAVNVQRRGSPPAKVVQGSMDDTIRETFRRLQG